MQICKSCHYIRDPEDEGEYCSYCLSKMEFDNWFEVVEA